MKLTQFLFNIFFIVKSIHSLIQWKILLKRKEEKKRKLIEMMSQLLQVLFRFGFCFHHKTVVFAQITNEHKNTGGLIS